MPRINALSVEEAEPAARNLLDGVQKKLGMTPNIMRTMAQSPAALDAYLKLSEALSKGKLSGKVREQIALTVAETNRCQYCLSAHTALAKLVGMSDEEVADSRRASSPDRKTEAVLHFAQAVVNKRGWVTNDELEEARHAGINDAEIVEIVATVALNLFTNYINHVAGTDVDFPEVEPSKAT